MVLNPKRYREDVLFSRPPLMEDRVMLQLGPRASARENEQEITETRRLQSLGPLKERTGTGNNDKMVLEVIEAVSIMHSFETCGDKVLSVLSDLTKVRKCEFN
jgi:hypothetical protein